MNDFKITYEQLQSLYDVSRDINSNLDLKEMLDRIIDAAIELVGAEKGLLLLKDDVSGELELQVARAFDKQSIENVVAMSRSIIGKVGSEGRPALIARAPIDEGTSPTSSMSSRRAADPCTTGHAIQATSTTAAAGQTKPRRVSPSVATTHANAASVHATDTGGNATATPGTASSTATSAISVSTMKASGSPSSRPRLGSTAPAMSFP